MSDKLLIRRDELGDCRDCGKSSKGVRFSGFVDVNHGFSDLYGDGGWWLRIEHTRDSIWPDVKDADKVCKLLCPDCVINEEGALDKFTEGL